MEYANPDEFHFYRRAMCPTAWGWEKSWIFVHIVPYKYLLLLKAPRHGTEKGRCSVWMASMCQDPALWDLGNCILTKKLWGWNKGTDCISGPWNSFEFLSPSALLDSKPRTSCRLVSTSWQSGLSGVLCSGRCYFYFCLHFQLHCWSAVFHFANTRCFQSLRRAGNGLQGERDVAEAHELLHSQWAFWYVEGCYNRKLFHLCCTIMLWHVVGQRHLLHPSRYKVEETLCEVSCLVEWYSTSESWLSDDNYWNKRGAKSHKW